MTNHTPRQLWHARMRARLPAEWRTLVDAIANHATRLVVANIVWWDWFGLRTMDDRWPDLDDYVNGWDAGKPPMPTAGDVLNALVSVGYTRKYARARV